MRLDELRDYFREVGGVVSDCDAFIGRLLDSDIHATVKKVYRTQRKNVPNLKLRDETTDRFVTIASTDIERAEIFNKQFLENTQLPNDFPPSCL